MRILKLAEKDTPTISGTSIENLETLTGGWCRGPDLNRQAVRRRILSIASLLVYTGFWLAMHGKSRVSGQSNAVYVNSG
jgi:hypothetical protein